MKRNEQLLKIPIFKGEKYELPLKFLSDLKKHLSTCSSEKMNAQIRQCLQDEAKNWFKNIENKVENFSQFKNKFKEKDWSNSIISSLKNKVNIGVFSTHKYIIKREKYAEQMMEMAEAVYPEKNEKEIIHIISMHFERKIKLEVKMKNLVTKKQLLNLLKKFDNNDVLNVKKTHIVEKISYNSKVKQNNADDEESQYIYEEKFQDFIIEDDDDDALKNYQLTDDEENCQLEDYQFISEDENYPLKYITEEKCYLNQDDNYQSQKCAVKNEVNCQQKGNKVDKNFKLKNCKERKTGMHDVSNEFPMINKKSYENIKLKIINKNETFENFKELK